MLYHFKKFWPIVEMDKYMYTFTCEDNEDNNGYEKINGKIRRILKPNTSSI